MSLLNVSLCQRQVEALRIGAKELLVGSDEGKKSGRSYLLRVAGLIYCDMYEGISVSLVKRSITNLGDDHLYGPSGLISLVDPLRDAGEVNVSANELRFKNGSTFRWASCGDDRQIHSILSKSPDVLLIDDIDEIPEHLYERMASHVLGGSSDRFRKVIAATRSFSTGWISRRWKEPSDDREYFPLYNHDLDEDLREDSTEKNFVPFKEYCSIAMPSMRWIKAREVMAEKLEDLAMGRLLDLEGKRIDRLMIRAPAQIGKSTMVQLFVAWWLSLAPHKTAASSTYSQDKANEFSYRVREYYSNAGGRIRDDSHAVMKWATEEGGGFWTRSVDSGAAGYPANLLVEDDLDKDLLHALQPKHRKMVREVWYAPVWLNRWNAEHGRLIEINIGTPHDIEDSQNFILNSPGVGEENASRHWHLLPLQAILDRKKYPILAPEGTVVAKDWRQVGDPIAPELPKFTLGSLRRFEDTMEPPAFAAMMQCTPLSSAGGGIINPMWFVRRDEDPGFKDRNAYLRNVRAWDIGHTEGGGDSTVGTKAGLEKGTNRIIIRHSVVAQKSAGGVKRLIAAMMIVDGEDTIVRLPKDPSAGVSWLLELVDYLKKVCRWLNIPTPKIIGQAPKGNKITKSNRIASKAEPPLKDMAVDEKNCGMVDIFSGTWTPTIEGAVPKFYDIIETTEKQYAKGNQEALEKLRELQAIAVICNAVFHDRNLARKQNIDSSNWVDSLLYELKMFDGMDGHKDDQVDALGDAIEEILKPLRIGGSSMHVPGW